MVRSAVLWTFSTQIVIFAIQFGGSVVIAHLLSPRELGIYAVSVAITGIAQLFSALGVANYVIREQALVPQTLHTAFTINTILAALLSAVIFVLSFAGARFLHDPAVGEVIRWLALTPVLAVPAFSPTVILQRAMQLRGISVIATFTAGLTTGITIAAALHGAGYLSPAYGSVAGAVFTTCATIAIGRRHLAMRLSLREWRPIVAFGLRLMSIGGISNVAVRLSDIVLGHFLGLAALGLYSRATNLSNTLFNNVYGSATRVVFAKLAEAQRNGDRVTEVFLYGFRIITAVMAPLLLGLAVLAGPVVHILYGERWADVAWLLALMLIGQLVNLTFAMNWELFVLRDELAAQTRLEVFRSGWGLLSHLVGSLISLVAVAWTNVIDAVVSMLVYQRHMPKLVGASAAVLYRTYGEAALLAAAAAAPALGLMIWQRWSPATPPSLIAVSVGVGVILWLATARLLHHPVLHELALFARRLTRRSPARVAV